MISFSIKKVLPAPVLICFGVCFFTLHPAKAQQIIFSEKFSADTLSLNWQKVNGNWRITAVDLLKIAAAVNGGRYVLSSGSSPGYMRVKVDIDTAKTRQIKLSFAYYTYPEGPGAIIEIEFQRKGYKDGLKGKWVQIVLPAKGRWASFQKNLKVPAEADRLWVTFSEAKVKSKISNPICIDNVIVSSID